MLVSEGYPNSFEKGKPILGLENVKNSIVFHAGTKKIDNNNIISNGGRVLAITSLGETMEQALNQSYENINIIHFDNKYFRHDIGFDLK
jgi:phosphoribosylamine--glycine ligase